MEVRFQPLMVRSLATPAMSEAALFWILLSPRKCEGSLEAPEDGALGLLNAASIIWKPFHALMAHLSAPDILTSLSPKAQGFGRC